jgi:hypothetical protein
MPYNPSNTQTLPIRSANIAQFPILSTIRHMRASIVYVMAFTFVFRFIQRAKGPGSSPSSFTPF